MAKKPKDDGFAKRMAAGDHKRRFERAKQMVADLYADLGVPRTVARASLESIREAVDQALEAIDQEVLMPFDNPNERRPFPIIAWGVLAVAIGLVVVLVLGAMN